MIEAIIVAIKLLVNTGECADESHYPDPKSALGYVVIDRCAIPYVEGFDADTIQVLYAYEVQE